MIAFKKNRKFSEDNKEHTVTITLSLTFDSAEFVIDTLPESCSRCPIGYMCNHDNDGKTHIPCGRRFPLDHNCRPPECKLKSIEQWLSENGIKQIWDGEAQ